MSGIVSVSEPLLSAGPRAAAEAAPMRTRQADKYSCEQRMHLGWCLRCSSAHI